MNSEYIIEDIMERQSSAHTDSCCNEYKLNMFKMLSDISIFNSGWAILKTLDQFIHWLINKNYYVVRNARCICSRNTWELSLIFYQSNNKWLNEVFLEWLTRKQTKILTPTASSGSVNFLGDLSSPQTYLEVQKPFYYPKSNPIHDNTNADWGFARGMLLLGKWNLRI